MGSLMFKEVLLEDWLTPSRAKALASKRCGASPSSFKSGVGEAFTVRDYFM